MAQHHAHDQQNEYDMSFGYRGWTCSSKVVDPTSPVGVVLHILNYIMAAPLFALVSLGFEKLVWARHVDLVESYGIVAASFVTALQCWFVVVLALSPFLRRRAQNTGNSKFVNKLLVHNAATSSLSLFLTTATLVVYTQLSADWNTGVGFFPAMRAWFSFALLTDFLFFILHRLMHFPQNSNLILRWLAKAHRAHHHGTGAGDEVNPVPAAHAHWIEFAFNNISTYGPPIICMSHPLLHVSFRMFTIIVAVTGYSSAVFLFRTTACTTKAITTPLGFTDLLNSSRKQSESTH